MKDILLLKNSEIESHLELIFQKYEIKSAPVLFSNIAKAENIQIVTGDMEDKTGGYAIFKSRSKKIYVNRNDHKLRQRFTIAHELGHYFLHYLLNKDTFETHFKEGSTYFRNENSTTGEDPFEREANFFASRFLIPDHLLSNEIFKKQINLNSISDKELIYLADTFKVSLQAMTIRVSYL